MQATSVTSTGTTIPLSKIVRGVNPREYFDPTEMAELTNSVREQGIIQPILVRPLNDGFQIIAGERRYRAVLAAFGEDSEIPAYIREMTDAEADAAALVENVQRANMSPTEEAAAAAKMVGRLNGDRDEAARLLGWSRATIDKRLALMNCSASVRTALNERTISLGHAELLAALAKETQDKLLPVIVKEKKTVAELKGTIEQAASKLENAIFDKEECVACPHNSSLQGSMFAESITSGSCTNPSCYKTKTEDALTAITVGLKDEYPVIRIIRAGDNSSLVKLTSDGEKGVGEEQAKACRACANFGAAVSALPQAMGNVYKDRCFDPGCNSKKIAARLSSEQAAVTPPVDAKTPTKSDAKATTSAAPTGKAEPAEKKAISVSESDRVKAYREKVWRLAMKKEIASSPELSVQYLIAICMNGSSRHINSAAITKAFTKLTGKEAGTADLGKNAKLISESAPDVLSNMTTLLAASAMEQIDVHYLQQLAKHHALDLTKHWKLDKEFLDLLTKSEIEFVANQIGLGQALGADFKKLFSEKKQDLIDKLLAVESFDYSANIPSIINY